jgi:GT2 family glycosyltransferase
MQNFKVAVVILNYNGQLFLEKFLPTVLKHSTPHRVYVADNGSTDNSINYLKSNFNSVTVVANNQNFGYAKGYNSALKQIEADVYVLLNNDVEVTENWIEPILKLMLSDKDIAACQPKLLDYKKRTTFEYAGANGGYIDKYGYPFCRGRLFNTLEEDTNQYNHSTEVFWATGACLFVKAKAFWEVGGFDDDYFAHMEEIDLCWRLKNVGYKIVVEPKSSVYHVGGGTLNKISSQKTFLNFRNNLITLTKNHPTPFLVLKLIFRLNLDGIAAFKFLFDGQPSHFFAVIRAHFSYYKFLPSTLTKRKKMKQNTKFKFDLTKMYNGNIVIEYFLKGNKTFTELQKSFFERN